MTQAAPETTQPRSPVLVAIASWLVPGMGYWMIGHTKRGLTIGVTIVATFIAGILIGGIRVLDVPGFNAYGQPIKVKVLENAPPVWIMRVGAWSEIKLKPWSMAQILAGPVAIIGGAGSVMAAQPDGTSKESPAEVSHTPVNEAGTLYTSVAGMLNLLAIIDAAYRASRRSDDDYVSPSPNNTPANTQTAQRRREVA